LHHLPTLLLLHQQHLLLPPLLLLLLHQQHLLLLRGARRCATRIRHASARKSRWLLLLPLSLLLHLHLHLQLLLLLLCGSASPSVKHPLLLRLLRVLLLLQRRGSLCFLLLLRCYSPATTACPPSTTLLSSAASFPPRSYLERPPLTRSGHLPSCPKVTTTQSAATHASTARALVRLILRCFIHWNPTASLYEIEQSRRPRLLHVQQLLDAALFHGAASALSHNETLAREILRRRELQ
jgi:hypothetical protein